MSIDIAVNAGLTLPASTLRGQVVPRMNNEGDHAVSRPAAEGKAQFKQVLVQSLTQLAAGASGAEGGVSAGANGSDKVALDQALATFTRDLLGALAGAGSGADGAGLTKEALANSLEAAQSSAGNRYERNQALLNNFDTADADGDGAISREEAHAFNEANNIPTLEGEAAAPPEQSAVSHAYHPALTERVAEKLQGLIQQLADGSGADVTAPALQALEGSYDNLIGVFTGEAGGASLANFLGVLKGNLGALGATGNVVDMTA